MCDFHATARVQGYTAQCSFEPRSNLARVYADSTITPSGSSTERATNTKIRVTRENIIAG